MEQKNYTHVRQILGYDRLGPEELVAPLNRLMAAWSLWKNLFCTTMEQLSSSREGSKQKREHVKVVQTPAQRLVASGQLGESQRQRIEMWQKEGNPFVMKARIEELLAAVWKERGKLAGSGEEGGEEDPGGEAALALAAGPALRSVPTAKAKRTVKQPTRNQPASVSGL